MSAETTPSTQNSPRRYNELLLDETGIPLEFAVAKTFGRLHRREAGFLTFPEIVAELGMTDVAVLNELGVERSQTNVPLGDSLAVADRIIQTDSHKSSLVRIPLPSRISAETYLKISEEAEPQAKIRVDWEFPVVIF